MVTWWWWVPRNSGTVVNPPFPAIHQNLLSKWFDSLRTTAIPLSHGRPLCPSPPVWLGHLSEAVFLPQENVGWSELWWDVPSLRGVVVHDSECKEIEWAYLSAEVESEKKINWEFSLCFSRGTAQCLMGWKQEEVKDKRSDLWAADWQERCSGRKLRDRIIVATSWVTSLWLNSSASRFLSLNIQSFRLRGCSGFRAVSNGPAACSFKARGRNRAKIILCAF